MLFRYLRVTVWMIGSSLLVCNEVVDLYPSIVELHLMAISLFTPLYSGLNESSVSYFLIKEVFDMATLLILWPDF